MNPLQAARTCELHVHPGGCLTAEDLIELGKNHYPNIDWTLFTESYQNAFGIDPDPVALYEEALSNPHLGIKRFQDHYVYNKTDGGDFGRFQAKFNLIICVMKYLRTKKNGLATYFQQVVNRHKNEGINTVEYRCGCGNETDEGFFNFHVAHAQVLQQAPQNHARYIISLRRWAPEEDYERVQHLFNKRPDLIPIIVGIDFAHFEEGYPPKNIRALFERIHQDNQQNPERALEITYHVGESYFDKSLESAVRWCHEAAEMGVRRLGHAIALGLDPAIAFTRRPNAHAKELVSERLDQIAYDLSHAKELSAYGIHIDPVALQKEKETLQHKNLDEYIERPYNEQRLQDIHNRQRFVLDQLTKLGTVIESCPTSNLRIGGVPDPAHHPIHQFLKSNVNLAIGADDPGIFDVTLSDEIDWILANTNWNEKDLAERLGDPRRFLLSIQRPA
jgi:adenosine deaminase